MRQALESGVSYEWSQVAQHDLYGVWSANLLWPWSMNIRSNERVTCGVCELISCGSVWLWGYKTTGFRTVLFLMVHVNELGIYEHAR